MWLYDGFISFFRFKDKAAFGYGTSVPPNNNEPDNGDITSKKVIFCVHGKLSGCCTMIMGSAGDDKGIIDYQNSTHSEYKIFYFDTQKKNNLYSNNIFLNQTNLCIAMRLKKVFLFEINSIHFI